MEEKKEKEKQSEAWQMIVDLYGCPSCKKEIPEGIRECLEQAFGAGRSRAQVIRRGLQRPVFPDFPLQEMQRTGGCPEPGRTPGCGQEGENTERKEEIHG